MSRRRRPFEWTAAPLLPLLLAAFPVLFLFAENVADQLVLDALWAPLGLALAGALAVVLAAIALARDPVRGGLLAGLLVALFFSFGHVWLLLASVMPSRLGLAAIYTTVAIVGCWLIWRGGRWVAVAAQGANAVALVLVVFNVIRIGDFALDTTNRTPAAAAPTAVVDAVAGDRRPDVYFLVFDRYANTETLERLYDHDNGPFLDELERRGFVIVEDSWASYFRTAPSLLSTLSMEYLDGEMLRADDSSPPRMAPIHRRLQQRLTVPATFKQLGYEYIHVGSWWNPTSRNVDADRSLRYDGPTSFGEALLDTTALTLLRPMAGTEQEPESLERPELARRHTLYQFDRVEEAVRRPGPTFVFAHFLVPHPPYVFRADGGMTTPAERRTLPAPRLYTDQLEWTNQRVLELVDAALNVPAGREPIIILQADEGPYPPRFARSRERFDWVEDAEPIEILEKYGILNAMHLPGIDPAAAGVHGRLSPVNTFRIVLSQYFDADLPLLPDRVYLTPDYARMYDFVEYERP